MPDLEFEQIITKIASENIDAIKIRKDLDTHKSDEEDFIEVPVWELKSALTDAYNEGFKAKLKRNDEIDEICNKEKDKIIDDYAESSRVIALYLSEFCDRTLPYDKMIADAARKASEALKASENRSLEYFKASCARNDEIHELKNKLMCAGEGMTKDFIVSLLKYAVSCGCTIENKKDLETTAEVIFEKVSILNGTYNHH